MPDWTRYLYLYYRALLRKDTGADAFQEADITVSLNRSPNIIIWLCVREDLLPSLEECLANDDFGRPGPVLVNIPKDLLAGPNELTVMRLIQRHRPMPRRAEDQMHVMEVLVKATSHAFSRRRLHSFEKRPKVWPN